MYCPTRERSISISIHQSHNSHRSIDTHRGEDDAAPYTQHTHTLNFVNRPPHHRPA